MDNSVMEFVTVTLIFLLVLALTYFTTRWIGGYQKKQMSAGNIKIIDSYRLSNSKILEVVKCGDKCFLVAVCKDTITTIGEVDADTFDLREEAKKTDGENFGSVFSRFKINKKDKEEDKTDENNDTANDE